MPLDREHVTAASRIMLPTYAVIYLAAGITLLLQASSRTSGPAFDVPKGILSIHAWGWLFVILGAAEVLAMILHKRRVYLLALIPGAGLAMFWAVVVAASAFQSPLVSFTSGMWVAGMAVAQAASARSLARYETTS